jgi:hypothetical protein
VKDYAERKRAVADRAYSATMIKNLPTRAAIAFAIPVLVVFAFTIRHPQGYYFLLAGPLCGLAGGLAFGRRWGFSIVLGLCFGTVAFLFSLQDARSSLFSDVIWTGFVSAFLFWVAGGSAMLTLPAHMRFNGAATLAIPGAVAGMAFQFFYGPGRFLFDLGSRKWWGDSPWEHFVLWLIAGAGGGWLLGRSWQRQLSAEGEMKAEVSNPWAIVSILCGFAGLAIGGFYFLRSTLPLGLFNSLSPAGAASDWFWGWGLLAIAIGGIAAFKRGRRVWSAAGVALAGILVVASYRVQANPWKSQFNSSYAERLLRENGSSGDAVYAGNLILAQAALDQEDIANAKRYLLQAATTTGARRIEQNGLDTSVARVLFDRGEKDAVLEYIHRGRELWPQGAQIIGRWEAAIRAGRRPNFNTRGPGGGQGNQQGTTQNYPQGNQ